MESCLALKMYLFTFYKFFIKLGQILKYCNVHSSNHVVDSRNCTHIDGSISMDWKLVKEI